jgi:hypothetical protein
MSIDSPMNGIKCLCNDNVIITINEYIVNYLTTLKNVYNDVTDCDLIPLPKINSNVLKTIIQYCEQRHFINPELFKLEMTMLPTNVKEFVDHCDNHPETNQFDNSFFKKNDEIILDILLASDYLNNNSLLLRASRYVANTMKMMAPEDVQKKFGIEQDMTDEEIIKIKKQNEWAIK